MLLRRTAMNFTVMPAAQGSKLITHPASERSALRKVVRIGRTPAANQTGMYCHEFHMFSITDSSRLRLRKAVVLTLSLVEVLAETDPFR
jgi:hypothetical protein